MTISKSIQSIGNIANQLNQPLRIVRSAANAAGIKPELQIDSILYFRTADIDSIDKQIKTGAFKAGTAIKGVPVATGMIGNPAE